MKFRMSPFHVSRIKCVSGVSLFFMFTSTLLSIRFPEQIMICLFMIFLMLLSVLIAIKEMRIKGFPWVTFEANGVSLKWKLGVHEFLPWEKCLDIGVFIADYGGSRYTALRYWLYFSTTILTQKQLDTRKRPKLRQSEFIMVEYRPDVLNEVLKYIPKDRIRNLHLIEQQIFS